MNKLTPAVSIIIPMYNMEKYIGECLDSVLAQTFTDYEVIVVDDCSTDNSALIVESYLPKFNTNGIDKLKFIRSDKNSEGHPGIPRNIGMRFAIGEYLQFMDSDDAITPTALEELYPIAKTYNVDFLTSWDYYLASEEFISTDKKSLKKNSEVFTNITKQFKVPTPIVNDLEVRTKYFCQHSFATMPWNHLFRREFIAQHEITFPKWRTTQDSAFFFFAMCYAKKMVSIPNAFYIWRIRNLSNSRKVRTPEDTIHMRGSTIFNQTKILDDFMNKFEFFKQHIDFKYAVWNTFINWATIPKLLEMYAQIQPWQLDGFIRRELEKIEDKTPLTAFLFNRMNIFNLQLNQQNAIIQQMNAHIQQQNKIIQELKDQLQNPKRKNRKVK